MLTSASSPSSPNSRRVRLVQAENADALWEHHVAPWLQEATASAWREALPTGVVVPSRGYGFHLHQRVVEAGFPLAGIHFWTPNDLRVVLCRQAMLPEPAPPRDVRLLLGVAAEESAEREQGNRTAAAIATEPAALLRAFDELVAAGWDGTAGRRDAIGSLLASWRRLMDEEGALARVELDRRLMAVCRDREPVLGRLLLTGFDGAHWASWNFLVSAVTATARADVGLLLPRAEAAELDMTWVGSWEQLFGDAAILDPPSAPRPCPFALGIQNNTETAMDFHVAEGYRAEARVTVARALDYLQDSACTRLGLVVPGPGPLSREISRLLRVADIPHDDAFGSWRPDIFERTDWQCWIAFQRTPGLEALLRFLQQVSPVVLEALAGGGDALASSAQIQAALRSAYRDVLLDDVRVLAEWLKRAKRHRRVGDLLSGIQVLPLRTSFARYIEATERALGALGWSERSRALRIAANGLLLKTHQPIGRGLYLRWLQDVATTWSRERAPGTDQRYSRVHITGVADAEHRDWSHLIITSLSDGVWPPREDAAAYVDRAEIERLNAAMRQHNEQATGEGSQGEGHDTVEPGCALYLGEHEKRALCDRQFANLLENTSHRLALTCRLGDETQPETTLHPNEWFLRLYREATGKGIDDAKAVEEVERATLFADALLPSPEPAPSVPAFGKERFLQAHRSRRNETTPFGEFEFSHRDPPATPVVLSASRWQRALTQPALTWLGAELGVAPVDSLHAEDLLPQAVGNLCHRWLSKVGETDTNQRWRPVPPAAQWHADTAAAAHKMRRSLEGVLDKVNRRLPVWWLSTWTEALHAARQFGNDVASWSEWEAMATEYELPDTSHAVGEGEAALHLYGRLDLLLVRGLRNEQGREPGAEVSLAVDYKTGAVPTLTVDSIVKGRAVQVALYALALRAAGFGEASVALLRPSQKRGKEMKADAAAALNEGWRELARMQRTGQFGMHGEWRPEFGRRSAYPLATLAIDAEILRRKWVLTHPAWKEVVE